MAATRHSREQGLRVHHLANLGGLVALAGLDREPPDFLLGALISVAHESATLNAAQRAQVASVGIEELAGPVGDVLLPPEVWQNG
jgi:hypothetical protein